MLRRSYDLKITAGRREQRGGTAACGSACLAPAGGEGSTCTDVGGERFDGWRSLLQQNNTETFLIY